MNQTPYDILVVDDTRDLRELLCLMLQTLGYRTVAAENGAKAMEALAVRPFDLVLLDVMMPVMTGPQTLEKIKGDEKLRHIPVVMLSAVDDINTVARCIELGADDYLAKPFNSVILNARIGASLEKKRMRDREQEYLHLVQQEREKADRLLLNILPAPIAERLKAGETMIADHFEAVTVLFADIVDFTRMASETSPQDLVSTLNELFSIFDGVTQERGLEKIKTSGDAYIIASGLPIPRADHAQALAQAALELRQQVKAFQSSSGKQVAMRFGMHSGPVTGGVIGATKFIYDLWGDTVNIASRMESLGIPGEIQISEATYALLKDEYECEGRGAIDVKGKGEAQAYLLVGRRGQA